ncbi:MAG: hypothetical protein LBN04_02635, partial [Oscillospiraceae bacterium]|nr:hypothetical protein [Oscillospiraceae bacterium]
AIPVAVGALFALYALLGGAPPVGVALPYGLGILLGAGLYLALFSRGQRGVWVLHPKGARREMARKGGTA